MDRLERGELYVQKEEAEREVKRLRSSLKSQGEILNRLAQRLQTDPERLTFANAPDNLGGAPIHLAMQGNGIDWSSIPDKETYAQEIQLLRAQEELLSRLKSRLE